MILILLTGTVGCAVISGASARSYRRLQGQWTLDTYWTKQRTVDYAKRNWGDPERNERAASEVEALMARGTGTSLSFTSDRMVLTQGGTSSTNLWKIISYDSKDDSILIRQYGSDREQIRGHKRMDLQELVKTLGTRDGDLPHVLGIRFLDSRHIELFTMKVVAGKVTEHRASHGIQVFQWNPPVKAVPTPRPTATPRPTPTPVPFVPVVRPTPIPTLELPDPVPTLRF